MSGSPEKLILTCFQSPGDVIMMTAAVRDLHKSHPGKFLTDVRTPCPALWENSPYITPIADGDGRKIPMNYPLIHQSNELPYHFIHGHRRYLSEQLKLPIAATAFKGDIHLSAEEKSWLPQVEGDFWIINAGWKKDFTAKQWATQYYQAVVDHFQGRVRFVQVGECHPDHTHPELTGVINLVGKTDLRQMVRLMYHAKGVVCGVTMHMHLAAAVETRPGRSRNRPCVVIAGGREPSQWEAYGHHAFFHTNGALDCCDNGGCWKSRVTKLGDGDGKDNNLCLYPMPLVSGQTIAKCMSMIKPPDVIAAIERYLEFGR